MNNTVQHSPRPDATSHPTAIQLAGFLEGRLEPWEQARVARHLGSCPDCARTVGEMHRLLAASDALPPARLRHPIERFLAPLRRLAPLPVWGWHAIWMVLIFVGWFALLDPTQIFWLRSPVYMGLSFISVIIVTTHFLSLQQKFRDMPQTMWDEGVPAEEIDVFQARYMAPLLGYFPNRARAFFIQGGWVFIGISLAITLWNHVRFAHAQPGMGDSWGGVVIGFYNVVAMTSVEWAWGWGGRYLAGLARLLRDHRARLSPELLARARTLGFEWTLVSSVSMAWYLLAAIITGQAREPGLPILAIIVTALLLSLWGGYLTLETLLFSQITVWRQRLAAGVRMAVSTAAVMGVIAATWLHRPI